MPWTSHVPGLRSSRIIGAAITVAAVSYTAYQVYKLATSRPQSPPRPPTTLPKHSSEETKERPYGRQIATVGEEVNSCPPRSPGMANHTDHPIPIDLSPSQLIAACDASRSQSPMQKLQASGNVNDISQTESDNKGEEEEEHTPSELQSDTSEEDEGKGNEHMLGKGRSDSWSLLQGLASTLLGSEVHLSPKSNTSEEETGEDSDQEMDDIDPFEQVLEVHLSPKSNTSEEETDEDSDQEMDDIDSNTSEEEMGEDSDQEADDIDPFEQVLAAINLEALAALASETRKSRDGLATASLTQPQLENSSMSCSVDPIYVTGSYNVIYFITFADGLKWTARIPGKGLFFTELDIKEMNSDYHTMQYIRSLTSVPIPEVFHWSTSSEEIGTPYALMSFVDGSPLSNRWFDNNWSDNNQSREEKRLKALTGICAAMSQLYALQFDRLGSLEFDDASKRPWVGPTFSQEMGFHNAWGITYTSGPWDSMIDYLMDDWDEVDESLTTGRAADLVILRLAVESIPPYIRDQGRFHLDHADLNYQNIMVDGDANITGILDWDSSVTLPCSMGFGRYPSWLTRDWDPGLYGYDEEEDPPYDPNLESPPHELSRYRQHYASEFQKLNLPGYDPRQTRLSHIVESIRIACDSRMSRDWITGKLLDHAFDAKVPFKRSVLSEAYAAGQADEMIEQIREAFKHMWHAEWENGQEVYPENSMVDSAVQF